MPDAEIQGLGFQIVGDTTDSEQGLNALISTLTSLKTALGQDTVRNISGIATGLTRMAKAMQVVGGYSESLSNVKNALTGITNLDYSRIPEAAASIRKVGRAISKFSGLSDSVKVLSETTEQLSTIANLDFSGIANSSKSIKGAIKASSSKGKTAAQAAAEPAISMGEGRVEGVAEAVKDTTEQIKAAQAAADKLFGNISTQSLTSMSRVELLNMKLSDLKANLEAGIAGGNLNGTQIADRVLAIQRVQEQIKREEEKTQEWVQQTQEGIQQRLQGRLQQIQELQELQEQLNSLSGPEKLLNMLSSIGPAIMNVRTVWMDFAEVLSDSSVQMEQDLSNVGVAIRNLGGAIKRQFADAGREFVERFQEILPEIPAIARFASKIFARTIGDFIRQLGGAKTVLATIAQPVLAAGQTIISAFGRVGAVISNAFGRISQADMDALASRLAIIPQLAQRAARALSSGLVAGVKKATSALAKMSLQLATAPFRSVISGINGVVGALGRFAKALQRVILYRTLRGIISGVLSGVKEGIKNLYEYSRLINGTFAQSMDRLATDALYLKNALGSMAAPIINALAPAIDFLTDKIVALMDKVAQLFALLSGQSTYIKAAKAATTYEDAIGGAGKAAGKASKEVKKFLMSIDELNIVNDQNPSDSGGGGAGGVDYGAMFDEMPVTLEIPDKLKEIFQVFKDAWDTYGQETVDAAKGALESLKETALDIGDAFYRVFTDGYGFDWLRSIFQLLTSAFQLVKSISDAFREAWNDGDRGYKLFASLFGMFTSLNDTIRTFIDTFRQAWDEGIGAQIWKDLLDIFTNLNTIVKNLSDRFREAWEIWGKDIWATLLQIIEDVTSTFVKVTEVTAQWADSLDFTPLLQSFDKFLHALEPVVALLAGAFAWAWENILLPFGKWTIETAVPALLNLLASAFEVLTSVLSALQPVGKWIWENFLQPLANWVGDKVIQLLGWLTDRLTDLSKWIDQHQKEFRSIVVVIGSFTSAWLAAKAAVTVIKGIATAFKLLLSTLSPVTLAIGVAVAAFVAAYTQIEGFRDVIDQTIGKVKDLWEAFMESPDLGAFASFLFEAGKALVSGLLKGIWEIIKGVGSWLKEHLVDPIVNKVKGLFGIHSPSTVFADIGEDLILGLLHGISDTWESITSFFSDKLKWLTDTLSGTWESIKKTANDSWNAINGAIVGFFDGLKTNAEQKFDWIKDHVLVTWQTIDTDADTELTSVNDTISNKWEKLEENTGTWFGSIKDDIIGVWESLNKDSEKWWETITKSITTVFAGLQGKLSNVWTDLKEWWSGLKLPSINVGDAIDTAKRTVSKAVNEMSANLRIEVPGYASGGMVSAGELFMARENHAPELVGRMGNQTTVANNDQIIDGIASGVSEANREVINAIVAIGNQLISAVRESDSGGGRTDWDYVARQVRKSQNKLDRIYGTA